MLHGAQVFYMCGTLCAIVLRKDTVCAMTVNSVFGYSNYATDGIGGAYVYVPRDLISSYQTATNWSSVYAAHGDIFRPLEDYTVDGTTTGEFDISKTYTPHTPVYSASNLVFNAQASDVIDTNVPLYDSDGKYTIIAKITLPEKVTIASSCILSCIIDNSLVLNLQHNASSLKTLVGNFAPTGGNGSNIDVISPCIFVLVADGLHANMYEYDDIHVGYFRYVRTGTLPQSNATLKLGGRDDYPRYWNGTINNIKVYKDALSPLEIDKIIETLKGGYT